MKLNIEDLESDYPIDNFKFNKANKIKILPYDTSYKDSVIPDLKSFTGIIGECIRSLNSKKLPLFDTDSDLIENIISKVTTNERTILKDIVEKTLLDEKSNYHLFNKLIIPYLPHSSKKNTLKNIGKFIANIFFDNEIKEKILSSNDEIKQNLFYKIIIEGLPNLENERVDKVEYYKFNEELRSLFKKDILFMLDDEEFFIKNIVSLFKFYYFQYIANLAIELNSFFDESKNNKFYFSLSWEKISENRLCNEKGWKYLENKSSNLFSHINVLDLINYIDFDQQGQLTYAEIYKMGLNHDEILPELKKLEEYIRTIPISWNVSCDWGNFAQSDRYSDPIFNSIHKLFSMIDYQFRNSKRSKPYGEYAKWFKEFCKLNFIRNRGPLGASLAIDQDMLLFLTELCVKSNDKASKKTKKMRLKGLWVELSKRGLDFDNESKKKIVVLFEKLNLLEKKSDSGDAQYVKFNI